jgi:hypothetical protein
MSGLNFPIGRRKALKAQVKESSHSLRRHKASDLGYGYQLAQGFHNSHDSVSNMFNQEHGYEYLDNSPPGEVEQGTHQDDALVLSNQFECPESKVSPNFPGKPPSAFVVEVASKTISFDLYEPSPPLSDHLLSLVRYNLYRAVAANSWSLGIDPRLMHSDIPSPFTSNDPAISKLCLSLPLALRPTALQKSVYHHPYIDLFPFPSMRDRLLQVGDTIDEDMLCADFAGDNIDSNFGEHTGLIVWGEPWDPQAWEISEPLWKKWSWLLKECSGILETTNYWRQKRDEPPLVEIKSSY